MCEPLVEPDTLSAGVVQDFERVAIDQTDDKNMRRQNNAVAQARERPSCNSSETLSKKFSKLRPVLVVSWSQLLHLLRELRKAIASRSKAVRYSKQLSHNNELLIHKPIVLCEVKDISN